VQQVNATPQVMVGLAALAALSPGVAVSLAAVQSQNAGSQDGVAVQALSIAAGYAGSIVVVATGIPAVAESVAALRSSDAGYAESLAVRQSGLDAAVAESAAFADIRSVGVGSTLVVNTPAAAAGYAASIYALGAGDAGYQTTLAAQVTQAPSVFVRLAVLAGQSVQVSASIVVTPRQSDAGYQASIYLSGTLYGSVSYGVSIGVANFYRHGTVTPGGKVGIATPLDRHGDAVPAS
jgi:hypothetical protein